MAKIPALFKRRRKLKYKGKSLRPDPDISDAERENCHKLFHLAWGAARNAPGYEKEAWMHVQQGLINRTCI